MPEEAAQLSLNQVLRDFSSKRVTGTFQRFSKIILTEPMKSWVAELVT